MNKRLLYEGVDISTHNGNVNIKAVRDAGYKRVGIRAGYGKNNVDQRFINNAEACYNLNVPVMIYWFSYAYNTDMASSEADYAIAQAKKYWKTCPIAFDFEYDSVNYARKNGVPLNRYSVTDMAIAFLKKVKDSGYIPVIYTNRDYLINWFDLNKIVKELGTVYVWYARYISTLPETESVIPDIWQYSSKGKVPGINGNVDMNKFYTDFLECEKTDEPKAKCNINILNFQKAANEDGYRDTKGRKLEEDGFDGPNTQYVRKQIALKAKRKGLRWVAGSTGKVVEWWQNRCNEILGHNQTVDRRYGKTAREETIELQKKLNLKTDGIAGYNSIQSAFYN